MLQELLMKMSMLTLAGVSSMMVSFLVSVFYNTLLAWVLWYFFHSFQDPLPWSQCPVNENLTGRTNTTKHQDSEQSSFLPLVV